MKINNATPTPIVNNPIQSTAKTTKPSFKGKVADFLTLSRAGTMSRNLFIANAFTFLLGSRLITSRDKDEKREILIRDVPTIVIAVMGVPVIGEIVAKIVQKKTGFAIMKDGEPGLIAKHIFQKTKVKEVADYGQLKSWYKYDENLTSGFKGFSERLAGLGDKVSLKKIYSALGGDIAEKLKPLKDNNDEFLKEVLKDKNLTKSLEKALTDGKNKVLKQAEFLKTTTKIAGFGLTLAIIGVLIPKLNIFITETIHKNKKAEKEQTEKV